MAKRKTPGLNTSSMADISFLLLTFFLLTSSINTDMGIARRLPPPLPPNTEIPDVRERNIFVVNIGSVKIFHKDSVVFFQGIDFPVQSLYTIYEFCAFADPESMI